MCRVRLAKCPIYCLVAIDVLFRVAQFVGAEQKNNKGLEVIGDKKKMKKIHLHRKNISSSQINSLLPKFDNCTAAPFQEGDNW